MGAQETETWRSWNQPVELFRILGNLYYVGATDIAAYLVTTPEEHILVDGGHAHYFQMKQKLEALAADGDRTIFVNPDEYRAFVERKEQQFREELARQQADQSSSSDSPSTS